MQVIEKELEDKSLIMDSSMSEVKTDAEMLKMNLALMQRQTGSLGPRMYEGKTIVLSFGIAEDKLEELRK